MRKEITFRMRRAVFNPYKKNIAGEPVRMAELLLLKNGFSVAPDSQGNLGIFGLNGTEVAYFDSNNHLIFPQVATRGINNSVYADPNILGYIGVSNGLSIQGGLYMTSIVYYFLNIATSGLGLPPIFGLDNRTGLTGIDTSPIILYPQSSKGQPAIASGQLYRLTGRILATAGTGPGATYTLKWTEGGVVITKSLTISALDSDADFSALIQPDPNTSITAQLTAISGTGTTVNVAASVERLA